MHAFTGAYPIDLQSPVMWFCRVGEGGRWSRHGYDIGCYDLPKEYCSSPKKKIFDVAALNGSFFFYDSDGSLGTLGFADDKDGSESEPEARLGAFAVPCIDYPDGITVTYVVQSCGDLFLVNIAFHGFCVDLPGKLHVYRMAFSEQPAWRETNNIGDQAFLLGDCNFAASCSASGCGVKADCVYWLNCFSEKDSNLHVLELDNGAPEIVEQFENVQGVQRPFWIVRFVPVVT